MHNEDQNHYSNNYLISLIWVWGHQHRPLIDDGTQCDNLIPKMTAVRHWVNESGDMIHHKAD